MKTKIFLCIITLSLAFSCNKYLELPPQGSVMGKDVWSKADGIEQMLAGGYSRLRRILTIERPMIIFGDLPSNFACKFGGYTTATNIARGDYNYLTAVEKWGSWSPYFEVTTIANTILNHIDDIALEGFDKDLKVAQAKKNQIKGEAYFLFAYTYFYMVRIYGDLPLVKESIEQANQALIDGAIVARKRSPEKEILEYLLTYIDASTSLLDLKNQSDKNWGVRADRSASLTLKAHVLMWLAKDLNRDSQEFIDLTSEAERTLDVVVNTCGRSLVNYNDINAVQKMFDGQSTESIFELQISTALNESYTVNSSSRYNTLHGATYADASREVISSLTNYFLVDYSLAGSLYEAKDKRTTIFMQNFGSSMGDVLSIPFLLKYSTNYVEDPSNRSNFFCNSNVMLFRLSEAILLRAEALAKLKRYANARSLLNQIRSRAGLDAFTGVDSELLEGVIHERARELVGEGHSYYDRIRNDYWRGIDWMTPLRKQGKGYYWPVDMNTLLKSNPLLVQTPYWQTKINV